MTCFYGSRIREKTELCPQVPTTLVFPRYEEGFELESIIQFIEKKLNVKTIRTNYLHGFMNKKSNNFSATGYRLFSEWLVEKTT